MALPSLDEMEKGVAGVSQSGQPQTTPSSTPEEHYSGPSSVKSSLPSLDQMESQVSQTQSTDYDLSPHGFTGSTIPRDTVNVAKAYYGGPNSSMTDQEAVNHWVNDNTWREANSVAALERAGEAVTADPWKKQAMAYLGSQWENVPAFWEGQDRPATERAGRLWSNLWRNIADPVNLLAGPVGKGTLGLLARTGAKEVIGATGTKLIGQGVGDVAVGGAASLAQQTAETATDQNTAGVSGTQALESGAEMGALGLLTRGLGTGLKRLFGYGKDKSKVPPPITDTGGTDMANPSLNQAEPDISPLFPTRTIPMPEETQISGFEHPVSGDFGGLGSTEPSESLLPETQPSDSLDTGGGASTGLTSEEARVWDNYNKGINPYTPYDQKLLKSAKAKQYGSFQEHVAEQPKTPFQQINPDIDTMLTQLDTPEQVKIPEDPVNTLGDGSRDPATGPEIQQRVGPEIPIPVGAVETPFTEVVRELHGDGKVDGMTYLPQEQWAESAIQISKENLGHMDVREPVHWGQRVFNLMQNMGEYTPQKFQELLDRFKGIPEAMDDLMNMYTTQLNLYQSVARNYVEKLDTFGTDSPETYKAMVAYAVADQRISVIQKGWYGAGSQTGRALAYRGIQSFPQDPTQRALWYQQVAQGMMREKAFMEEDVGNLCRTFGG